MEKFTHQHPAIWGGIECTINRVGDQYNDQLYLSDHYKNSSDDINLFKSLGIKSLRYPLLWEKYAPGNKQIDWSFAEKSLREITTAGIEPIVGLVHHGSGPAYTNFFDDSFATGLGEYALKVATRFPFVKYFTPVNEPLTTARFCGLYGFWHPHEKNAYSFYKILLAELKGTVLAMNAVRQINPDAKLVQTEDLGKTYATPEMQYQADYENKRRWLTFDLLCGLVNEQHAMWAEMVSAGIEADELLFFVKNPCPPDIMGLNYYITSERWLDNNIGEYPDQCVGQNAYQQYVDVEAVRAGKLAGPEVLIREAWDRYKIQIAITEVHLHCTREEQLRWFWSLWQVANKLIKSEVNIVAVTAWALLGSFDWCRMLTCFEDKYESGVFDIRNNTRTPTALAKMIRTLANDQKYFHAVLQSQGWWEHPSAVIYPANNKPSQMQTVGNPHSQPLLIIGKTGTLGSAFARICKSRFIEHRLLGRQDIDIMSPEDIERVIKIYKPWAIVNAAGYVKVDEAENEQELCFQINSVAPQLLAAVCNKHNIQFATFSSDLVFDGKKNEPYIESDHVAPLNVYGTSKALAEKNVLEVNSRALIIRTSAFFGPWDRYNFAYNALCSLKNSAEFLSTNDVIISPSYVPDVVHSTLDLIIDEATGIWNVTNNGGVSWADFYTEISKRSGAASPKLRTVPLSEMGYRAPRPFYSVMATEKSYILPSLENAIDRFFCEVETL